MLLNCLNEKCFIFKVSIGGKNYNVIWVFLNLGFKKILRFEFYCGYRMMNFILIFLNM